MYNTRIDYINQIFNYKNEVNQIKFFLQENTVFGTFLRVQDDINYNDIKYILTKFLDSIYTFYPNCDYFLTSPGTKNPYLAKAIIETGQTYGTDYRIFFGKNEIYHNEIENFKTNTIDAKICEINNLSCRTDVSNRLSNYLYGSICLKDNMRAKSPFKYYEYDQDQVFIAEYDEKPSHTSNIYIANNLSDRYQTHTIKYINDQSLIFMPK